MKNNYSKIFIILLAINITFLLVSNIITSKLILIFGLVFTAGDFLFPITYILNDVFAEVYGYEKTKLVVILSFICNLIMVTIFYVTIFLPYPDYLLNQEGYMNILLSTPRILLASFLSYIIGSIVNAKILNKIKFKNKNSKVYQRTILSSLIGELVDTVIFITITFIGTITMSELIKLVIDVYILKIIIEIVFTPVTCIVINKIKQIEERMA